MPHNDNQFDQLFRDRLKDHSSPVRHDLWRRIHTRIGRQPALHPWRWIATTTGAITTIAATVTLATIYFLVVHHHPSPSAATADNHYSTIPATARTDSSRNGDLSSTRSATPATRKNSSDSSATPIPTPVPAAATTSIPVPAATSIPAATTVPTHNPRIHSVAASVTPTTRTLPDPSHHKTDQSVFFNQPRQHNTAALTGHARPVTLPGHARTITLPGLARTSGRPTVTATPPMSPARPKNANNQNPASGISLFDHLYLALFGGADFPTHYYEFSTTGGIRVTVMITQHWSATTGLQFSKVNIRRKNYDSLGYPAYFANLDLSILAGYTIDHDHYRLTITGGAIINLYSRATGGNIGWGWPNRTGPSATVDVAYDRILSDQWTVFAEPYVRCLFADYKSLLPSQTWSEGLLLGIRYHL